MRKAVIVLIAILIAALSLIKISAVVQAKSTDIHSPLDFSLDNINGELVNLSEFKGNVVMMVNVASKCGNTPQYESLQAMFEKYKDQGFVILGFPANNFKGQEPGTNEEIKQFCSLNYGVTFPLFSKISVKGEDQHPLYKFLTGEETNPGFSGDIKWNFGKFLISKQGKVINRFTPKTKPNDAKVIEAIESALKS